jgi:iron(III) transport system permease protein
MFSSSPFRDYSRYAVSLFGVLLFALPVLALFFKALTTPYSLLQHLLISNGLIYTFNTLFLAFLVPCLAVLWGGMAATVLHLSNLPFKPLLRLLHILPLAMPGYLAAYIYGALPLPFIFSHLGAAILLSAVLYPYIFVLVSVQLEHQSARIIEAALGLGATPWRVLKRIILPLCRPAFAAGMLRDAVFRYSNPCNGGVSCLVWL